LPWERRSKYTLHKFTFEEELGAADDYLKLVLAKIRDWTFTAEGKWCVENATDLECHFHLDHSTLYYQLAIVGKLSPKHSTFRTLKFS
jgi:hypothetical protein